jgi:hypothetical protein
VAHRSFGSITIELLNSQGQIVKSLEAELRSILHRRLWLGCRDRKQKACAVAMLDLVADREVSAAVNRSNDPERPAEQRMRRIAHYHFDNR